MTPIAVEFQGAPIRCLVDPLNPRAVYLRYTDVARALRYTKLHKHPSYGVTCIDGALYVPRANLDEVARHCHTSHAIACRQLIEFTETDMRLNGMATPAPVEKKPKPTPHDFRQSREYLAFKDALAAIDEQLVDLDIRRQSILAGMVRLGVVAANQAR